MNTTLQSPLRAATLLTVLTLLLSLAVNAQTTPSATANQSGNPDAVVMEAFVTTGSNIKRLDQENVLPISMINLEMIQARDSTTPMDLLIGIPEVTNIPDNETATNASATRGGAATAALRGLGSASTLVLLNGRRIPTHPLQTPSVNINVLPTFGIAQIEVLRDGASSIYGSDAVAGVINYVTESKPNGSQVALRYGFTEHGGGMDIDGKLGYSTTFAEGKGTLIVNLEGYYRDSIFLKEREFSKTTIRYPNARPPWNIPGSAYDGATAVGIYPAFFLGTSPTASAATNYFYPLSGVAGDTPALNKTAMPRSLYENYNQYIVGQPQSRRENFYTNFDYQLTKKIRFFSDLSLYDSHSVTARQPITDNVSDARISLSADNPYNPFGSSFYSLTGAPNANGTARLTGTPQAITIVTVLMKDGGPERIEGADNMYRALAGFNGTIGESTWKWETAALIGGVRALDLGKNSVQQSKLIAAANRTDATAWNPFSYTFKVANGQVVTDQPYTNPQSVRDTYTNSGDRYGHTKLASYDAHATGEIIKLWAGPISASLGAEWRYESRENHWTAEVMPNAPSTGLDPNDNDILIIGPKGPFHGSRAVSSGYAETVVPLAIAKNQIPFVQSLELSAAARFEHYSDFGNTTNPKYGINWKPVPSLMVRASVNQGFRAPPFEDLYKPAVFSVGTAPGSRDPVRNTYITAAGLPPDAQILTKGWVLPNPIEGPETSRGKSAGIVWEVPKVKGLSFSVDYWEITQHDLIVAQSTTSGLDESLLRAYTQAQLAAGKAIDSIDVGSRVTPFVTTRYEGDPFTLRQVVTPADIALFDQTYAKLPQSQWIAPLGAVIGSISVNVNSTGKNFTNGLDYGISYSLPRTRLGQFRLSTEWSEFLNKYTKSKPGLPKNDEIHAMVTAKWKSSATIQWRNGGWDASVNAAYESDSRTGATATAAQYAALNQPSYIKPITVYSNTGVGTVNYYEVGKDQLQINAGIAYRFGPEANHWLRRTSFRLGINNLLDEQPAPANVSSTGYAGGTGSSLWVGRAYSFTVTRDF